MNQTFWGAVMLALAVSIGAFGAHGLQGKLDAYSMNIYERAVLYHFIHALGILLVAALAASNAISLSMGRWAGIFAAGWHRILLRQFVCAGAFGKPDVGSSDADWGRLLHCGLGGAGGGRH